MKTKNILFTTAMLPTRALLTTSKPAIAFLMIKVKGELKFLQIKITTQGISLENVGKPFEFGN